MAHVDNISIHEDWIPNLLYELYHKEVFTMHQMAEDIYDYA